MFLIWEGFINRLMQIYRDLKAEAIVEYRLWEFTQQGLVIKYIT
jgi:hypothetical protein